LCHEKLLLHPVAKPVLFVLALLPLAWLVYAAATNQLGANPAEALIRATGDWTLRPVPWCWP
jgi:sulfoxide reductase heme-binding subunit YedZ